MGKHSHARGLDVDIIVGGRVQLEYKDEEPVKMQHEDPEVAEWQTDRTQSRYIAVNTDDHFSIKCQVTKPLGKHGMKYSKIIFEILVDGIEAAKAFCERPFFTKGGITWVQHVDGVTDGKGKKCTLRDFTFAKIETNSDYSSMDSIKRQAQRMQQKGTIEVRVYYGDYGKKGGDTPGTSQGFSNKGTITVPERVLKGQAKSHVAALDEKRKKKRDPVWRCTKEDGPDFPIAIYKFMYRSEEALKQLGIIERTPSPTPTPAPDLPRLRRLARIPVRGHNGTLQAQLAKMEVEMARIQALLMLSGNDGNRTIKQEDTESGCLSCTGKHASKRAKKNNGEVEVIVIDDSDDETSLFVPL